MVTEYIEYRWSPANVVAYSPADWTDPDRRGLHRARVANGRHPAVE